MKAKSVLFFVLAVTVSLAGSAYNFFDSAHSMGLITVKGGRALHPAVLDGGKSSYTVIATATVLPPYQGDARIALEGDPHMIYSIYSSDPVIDIGLHRRPRFDGSTLHGLRPGDRLALWIVMKPRAETGKEGSDRTVVPGSCCPAPEQPGQGKAGFHRAGRKENSRLTLTFSDPKSDMPLLRIPIIFRRHGSLKGGEDDS